MRACKCDRCKTYFDFDNDKIKIGTCWLYMKYGNGYDYDLCPKCKESFKKWWNEGATICD